MSQIGRFPYPSQSNSADNLRFLQNMASALREGWDFEGVCPLRWDGEEQVNFLQSIFDGVPPGLVVFWKDDQDVLRVLDGRERINTLQNVLDGERAFFINIQTGKVSLDTEPSPYNIPLRNLALSKSLDTTPFRGLGLSDGELMDVCIHLGDTQRFLNSFWYPTMTLSGLSLEQALYIRNAHNRRQDREL